MFSDFVTAKPFILINAVETESIAKRTAVATAGDMGDTTHHREVQGLAMEGSIQHLVECLVPRRHQYTFAEKVNESRTDTGASGSELP